MSNLIPAHGGYRKLKSFQMSTIVYDLTLVFIKQYVPRGSRTNDQMHQAARSGKQNIAEGSMASGTSKKTEIKLVGVARASLEELLLDYEDYLREHQLGLWSKEDARIKAIRALSYTTDKSYKTYLSYLSNPQSAANCLICIIHQTNYLLDQQLRVLDKELLEKGGFTENLYQKRTEYRKNQRK